MKKSYIKLTTLTIALLLSNFAYSQVNFKENKVDELKMSSALGQENISTGEQSFASGYNVEASGDYSTALGYHTTASGQYSFANGYRTISRGISSFASGYRTIADANMSFAHGYFSQAYGKYSTAIGYQSKAMNDFSVAIGYRATSGANHAFAFGENVQANSENSFVIGKGFDDENFLINNTTNSFMVGFNSKIPTFYVGPSYGSNRFGKVGIGTTHPTSTLDVNGTVKATNFVGNGSGLTNLPNQSKWLGNGDSIYYNNGNVGIGTTSPGNYKLAVNGKIKAKEVHISVDGWSDFVFQKNYNLKTLDEVEQFIKKNKHLPDIPSEKEVLKEGLNVGDMNKILLQKIEELTLYVIDLKKEIEDLKK